MRKPGYQTEPASPTRLIKRDLDPALAKGASTKGIVYCQVIVLGLVFSIFRPTVSFIIYGFIVVAFTLSRTLGKWELIMIWSTRRKNDVKSELQKERRATQLPFNWFLTNGFNRASAAFQPRIKEMQDRFGTICFHQVPDSVMTPSPPASFYCNALSILVDKTICTARVFRTGLRSMYLRNHE